MNATDPVLRMRPPRTRGRARLEFMGAAALIGLEALCARRGGAGRASPFSPADVLIAAALFAGAAAAAIAQPAAPANAAGIAVAVPLPGRPAPEGGAGPEIASRPAAAQAQAVNAAMPFAAAPSEPARPFVMSGSPADQARALLCLTQAVYYEAGFEPVEGRRAVAQVVLNRVRHPAFPNSVCGVVYEAAPGGRCQFSFVCNGDIDRRPAPRAWAEAAAIARDALSGHVEPSVGEATHYHADYVMPRWAPMLAKVAVIGHHIFYRWPGAWGEQAAFTQPYGGEPRDASAARARLAIAAPGDAGAERAEAQASRAGSYSIPALLDGPMAGGAPAAPVKSEGSEAAVPDRAGS